MCVTLKDLFIENESYILEIDINEEYYLFCEGLDENGCTNTVKDNFDVNNIKNLCLELFERKAYEYIESIDSRDITPNEKIEDLKEKTLNLLGGDYVD